MKIKPKISACPTCNQPTKKTFDTSKPELIYKRVLEIGSECITCGISFNDLFNRLKSEHFEFDENGCLERCLREWFWNSFFHEEAHCKHKDSQDDIKQLNEHLTCKFILRAESCMKLLTFKESEQNQSTAEINFATAKKSNNVAIIGLIIAILTLGYSLYKDHNDNIGQEKHIQDIKELLRQEISTTKTLTTKPHILTPNISESKPNIQVYKEADNHKPIELKKK
jgi:hypothetical protein